MLKNAFSKRRLFPHDSRRLKMFKHVSSRFETFKTYEIHQLLITICKDNLACYQNTESSSTGPNAEHPRLKNSCQRGRWATSTTTTTTTTTTGAALACQRRRRLAAWLCTATQIMLHGGHLLHLVNRRLHLPGLLHNPFPRLHNLHAHLASLPIQPDPGRSGTAPRGCHR
jgi:hypothetical protein